MHPAPHALSCPRTLPFPLLSVTIGRVFVTQVKQEAGQTVTKTQVMSCAFDGRVPVDVDERLLAAAPRNLMDAISQVLVIARSREGAGLLGRPFTPCLFACVPATVFTRRTPRLNSRVPVIVDLHSRRVPPQTLGATRVPVHAFPRISQSRCPPCSLRRFNRTWANRVPVIRERARRAMGGIAAVGRRRGGHITHAFSLTTVAISRVMAAGILRAGSRMRLLNAAFCTLPAAV